MLHGLLDSRGAFAENEISGISLCSTVPSVLHQMREMCARYYGGLETVIVGPGVKTGVPVRDRCGPTTPRKWAATAS